MNIDEMIFQLSKELLDDIELSRISGEQLLLKMKRLVRLTADTQTSQWIDYELRGYKSTDYGKQLMSKTGRWIDKDKNTGYWSSLCQIEAHIESNKIKLSCLRTPDLSGDKAWITNRDVTSAINELGNQITIFSGIKSRVISLIHDYVAEVYYRNILENVIESIFISYKSKIDISISEQCSDVLEMLPHVMKRLIEKDTESISQALLTCRRIIDVFADNIFPASDEVINIDGNELSLTQDKVKNRINAFINQKCDSVSRKKRLRQNLTNLYERVSTGVHDDVTAEEAQALVMNTYLIIGEIVSL